MGEGQLFADFKAEQNVEKEMEKIVAIIQQIADERHEVAVFKGNIVKQALLAQGILESQKSTKADLQDALSRLITVCKTAPGVTINYY